MINNQNIGVLSEKVARLESDIKTLALPSVTSSDAGKSPVVNSSGAWEAANINADDVIYSEGVSVKDKIDDVDDKLTGKVLSGAIENATTKTLDVIEGVGIIFIYRSTSGLYAMVTQYSTTFTTVGGQLPDTITLGYANNKITITNNAGYTIGYTVINNPWV